VRGRGSGRERGHGGEERERDVEEERERGERKFAFVRGRVHCDFDCYDWQHVYRILAVFLLLILLLLERHLFPHVMP